MTFTITAPAGIDTVGDTFTRDGFTLRVIRIVSDPFFGDMIEVKFID